MGDDALLSPGLLIAGTYEIVRLLGRGGMGEVWLASHRRLAGKQVAVKVLRAQGPVSGDALARFEREALIAVRLEHPNICQVLDYNRLPTGEPYLVMEYLRGQSLAERVREGPLSLEQVQALVRQVGAALLAAHAAGVVHRDLKPENLFLVPTALGDQVKVLDFGISKRADSAAVQTTDSVLIGTPLYMSPEQALGQNQAVGPRSDLFSLGSICFELLTGQAPFRADSVAQVVFRIAYEATPSLSALRSDLPPAVVAAVERALTKDQAQRTPDIGTFVAEFTLAPLVAPHEPLPAGVYAQGMAVSESLVSGKTAAPAARPLATPAPPPPAPVVSGKRLAVGLVGAAVLASAAIVYTRVGVWQNHLLPVQPDAGPASASVPPPPAGALAVDAGAAPGERDAGPRASHALEPADIPGPEDQETLARLQTLHDAADYEALETQRSRIRGLTSRRARQQALLWLIDAQCHRASNQLLGLAIAELKALSPPSTLRAARTACVATYPAAADLGW